MDYLKLFQTHEEYETFVSGGTMMKPNVSHCISENEVHYNPIETKLIVKYNVIDASQPTQLYYYYVNQWSDKKGEVMFDNVEIDGIEVSITDLDAASGQTQLSAGEHTVKYTLKDPTFIGIDGDPGDPSTQKVGAMFGACERIASIEIPNTVRNIGTEAFNSCISLTSVTIPNSVERIGLFAFSSCIGLTNITIPSNVEVIGNESFESCVNLTSVTISDGITDIGLNAFRNCSGLTNVTIPNSVTYIDNYAFRDCSSLTTVNITNSATSVGWGAFCNCPLDNESRTTIESINTNATDCGRPV